MGAGYRYLCDSWQGLLQMTVYLCGQGYYYYHVTCLPEKKRERWAKTDAKLIKKYRTNKSKWQRARQKQKGLANFIYLRWHNIAVIMHTMGRIDDNVTYDDPFYDVRKKPMRLPISELLEIEIYKRKNGSFTCRLTSKTYRGIKQTLRDVARLKNVKRIYHEYNKLNGIPAWGGVIEQKRQLAKYLVRQARKHQINLSEENLRLVDKRWPTKVWAEEQPALSLENKKLALS